MQELLRLLSSSPGNTGRSAFALNAAIRHDALQCS